MEMELLCELENNLLDVKWSQNALNFCRLLLKVSKDIQELERNSNGMSNQVIYEEAEKVLKKLQDITDSAGDSSVNPIAEKLLGTLSFDNTTEGREEAAKTKEGFASLLKINDTERTKYADAKDYLQQMIYNMKSVVETKKMQRCDMYQNFDPLERLVISLSSYGTYRADKILGIVFQIGKSRLEFTEEQQKKIGVLMIEAIEPIQLNIEICQFDSPMHHRMLSLQKKRSALQFLLDEYGKFPAGASTLHQEFEKANMMGTVEILNSLIARWQQIYLDRSVRYLEISGRPDLPDSHMD